jgi:NTE family protein
MQLKLILSSKQQTSMSCSTILDAFKEFFWTRNNELYALVLPFNKMKIGIEALSKECIITIYWEQNLKIPTRARFQQTAYFFFVCIGTNIETGEEVLLNKGNLAQAMIISSAFHPYSCWNWWKNACRWWCNNYPIWGGTQVGADIVIGVDVQDGLLDRSQLKMQQKYCSNYRFTVYWKDEKFLIQIFI